MFSQDIAHGSIKFSRQPFCTSQSKRLKLLEHQANFDEGLKPLEEATKLIIEEASGFSENAFNCRYHFDIVDQDGTRLYHISESSARLAHVFEILPARLQFGILDAQGRVLLLISGYDAYCGHPTDFSVERVGGEHLGHILQKSGFLCGKPKFYVCNRNQEVTFRVNSTQFVECMYFGGSADFRILKKKTKGMEYGIIKKFPPTADQKSTKENYGVTFFDEDMEISEKVLLMIMTVVLHLRFYKPQKDIRAYYYRKTSDVSLADFEVTNII